MRGAEPLIPLTTTWQPERHLFSAQLHAMEQQYDAHFLPDPRLRKRKLGETVASPEEGDDDDEVLAAMTDATSGLGVRVKRPCFGPGRHIAAPVGQTTPVPMPTSLWTATGAAAAPWAPCAARLDRKRKASEELFNERMAGLRLARPPGVGDCVDPPGVFGEDAEPASLWADGAGYGAAATTHVLVPQCSRPRAQSLCEGSADVEEFELVDKRLADQWAIVLHESATVEAPGTFTVTDPRATVLYRPPEGYIADIWRRHHSDELAEATGADHARPWRPPVPSLSLPHTDGSPRGSPAAIPQPFLAELSDDAAVRAFLEPNELNSYADGGAYHATDGGYGGGDTWVGTYGGTQWPFSGQQMNCDD